MKNRTRYSGKLISTIVLWLIMPTTIGCSKEKELFVGCTKSWIFATDADLNIVWKKAYEGFQIWSPSDSEFLADKTGRDSTELMLCNVCDGETKWIRWFPAVGILPNWERDSVGRALIEVQYVTSDSSFVQVLDAATGRIRSSVSEKMPASQPTFCPVLPVVDTITFFETSHYLCALTPDLRTVWKLELGKRYEFLGWSNTYARLATGEMACAVALLKMNRTIAVIAREDGRTLWHKTFPTDFTVCIGSDKVTIRLSDGITEAFNTVTGAAITNEAK